MFEYRYARDRAPLVLSARSLPAVPELSLFLFPDALPADKLSKDDFYQLLSSPPYWAFCWGGGQALARWLLDNPAVVVGRRVWDFGAGSGIAGLAALRAGAALTVAVDTDPAARDVCCRNAQLNQLVPMAVADVCEPQPGDVVLAADICYEEAGLAQVRAWAKAGVSVLVAESRIDDLRLGVIGLELLSRRRLRTFPDLDEAERFDVVSIYRVNV